MLQPERLGNTEHVLQQVALVEVGGHEGIGVELFQAFAEEAYVARRAEMTESRAGVGKVGEEVFLNWTPAGDVVAVYLEGNDPLEANRRSAAASTPCDRWFEDRCEDGSHADIEVHHIGKLADLPRRARSRHAREIPMRSEHAPRVNVASSLRALVRANVPPVALLGPPSVDRPAAGLYQTG